MNIGEAERATGLPAKTIRYYEEIGLIRPLRAANGYRRFRDSDAHKLRFLGRARSLGFSIEDCRALLALWEDRARASADVKALAARHLAEVDRKLTELSMLRDTLADLVDTCHGDDRPDCPILHRLAAPIQAPG
jgi:Cu(I)-responsive transcriptional regulator